MALFNTTKTEERPLQEVERPLRDYSVLLWTASRMMLRCQQYIMLMQKR